MDMTAVRRTAIKALCSDDVLLERLVLKGGNALALIYGVGGRASLDLDYSIESDFEDLTDTKRRLDGTIQRAFAELGYVAFDQKFELRPPLRGAMQMHPNWGGYLYSFKLLPKKLRQKLSADLQQMRSQALTTQPREGRTFRIDISRFEVCQGKQAHELDDLQLYVYSPAMLLAEKLRALCQQDPEYTLRGHPAPRARDFFDIHTIVTKLGVSFAGPEFVALLGAVFVIKQVPLSYLGHLPASREFHRADWASIEATITNEHESYDFYFDYVLKLIAQIPWE